MEITANSIYLLLSGIGFIFLLISTFGGDLDGVDIEIGEPDFDISDAEVDTDGPKLLSMRSIAAFLLAFGIGALFANMMEWKLVSQIISGILSGVGTGYITYLIMKLMYSQQGTGNVSTSTMVGKKGTVAVATSKATGNCMVKIQSIAGHDDYMAKEVDGKLLAYGDDVEIVSTSSGKFTVKKL